MVLLQSLHSRHWKCHTPSPAHSWSGILPGKVPGGAGISERKFHMLYFFFPVFPNFGEGDMLKSLLYIINLN